MAGLSKMQQFRRLRHMADNGPFDPGGNGPADLLDLNEQSI